MACPFYFHSSRFATISIYSNSKTVAPSATDQGTQKQNRYLCKLGGSLRFAEKYETQKKIHWGYLIPLKTIALSAQVQAVLLSPGPLLVGGGRNLVRPSSSKGGEP